MHTSSLLCISKSYTRWGSCNHLHLNREYGIYKCLRITGHKNLKEQTDQYTLSNKVHVVHSQWHTYPPPLFKLCKTISWRDTYIHLHLNMGICHVWMPVDYQTRKTSKSKMTNSFCQTEWFIITTQWIHIRTHSHNSKIIQETKMTGHTQSFVTYIALPSNTTPHFEGYWVPIYFCKFTPPPTFENKISIPMYF